MLRNAATITPSRTAQTVDQLLQQRAVPRKTCADGLDPKTLLGKTAIANTELAHRSLKRLRSSGWRALAAEGARVQRLLWASTGTKNPNYPELMYVEPQIAPETINTMPEKTIAAFLDHGTVAGTVEQEDRGRGASHGARSAASISISTTSQRSSKTRAFRSSSSHISRCVEPRSD